MRKYDIDPEKLQQVFHNTTATYKFYWLQALLDVVRSGKAYQDITFNEMVARMISKAWIPLTSGLFTFGKSDKISARIHQLIFTTELRNCDNEDRVRTYLTSHANDESVIDIVDKMTKYVPYRFLYPWLGADLTNKQTAMASSNYEKYECPYCINYAKKQIRLFTPWIDYLNDHLDVYEAFAKYNLFIFLVKYNDNILLPEEESLHTMTADGLGITYGLVSEAPIPNDISKEIALLKTKLKKEKEGKQVLQGILSSLNIQNSFNFKKGSKNTIFANGVNSQEDE